MIEIIRGDITKIAVDAMVNAANTSLLGGGGVDGAIHCAGGSQILEDCKKIISMQGGCKTGQAVLTRAGNLPAKFVIHTVGPVWNGGTLNESELLKNCYINALKIGVINNCKSISFPGISTGIYRFPKDLAAQIAVRTVHDFLEFHLNPMKVIFVCFDDESEAIYQQEMLKY